MAEIFAIVECRVEYNDGTFEIKRPTFSQIATGIAMVNTSSVVEYLRGNLKNVREIRVLDVWYFKNAEDYNKYMKTELS